MSEATASPLTPATPITSNEPITDSTLSAMRERYGMTAGPHDVDGLIPNQVMFSGLINQISKTYSYRYDEALRHLSKNAMAMRRDCYLMSILRERQYPTAQLPWELKPEDPLDKQQVALAQSMTKVIERTPRWQQGLMSLLEALWYGRYGLQKHFERDVISGQTLWYVSHHEPVNGDKIQFQWDQTPAIQINPAVASLYPQSEILRSDRGVLLRLSKREWRNQFCIHRHEIDDADYTEPEMAGGIGGVGIRHRIYWCWWMRDECLSWALNFMQKVGTMGLLVFWYELGNQQSKLEAERAAAETSADKPYLVMGKPPGDKTRETYGVQPIQPTATGIDALMKMISQYFESHMERYIIGQKLSSGTEGSGLGGSGVAGLHADTKSQILKFDATNLQETLTEEFVLPLLAMNYPGTRARLKLEFKVPRPEDVEKMDAVNKAYQMGVSFREDDVRGLTGFTKPEPGEPALSNKPPSQPGGGMPPGGGGGMPPQQGQPSPDEGGGGGDGDSDNPFAALFGRFDRPRLYGWEPHTIQRGPRKGTAGFLNTDTGEFRDQAPAEHETGKASADQSHAWGAEAGGHDAAQFGGVAEALYRQFREEGRDEPTAKRLAVGNAKEYLRQQTPEGLAAQKKNFGPLAGMATPAERVSHVAKVAKTTPLRSASPAITEAIVSDIASLDWSDMATAANELTDSSLSPVRRDYHQNLLNRAMARRPAGPKVPFDPSKAVLVRVPAGEGSKRGLGNASKLPQSGAFLGKGDGSEALKLIQLPEGMDLREAEDIVGNGATVDQVGDHPEHMEALMAHALGGYQVAVEHVPAAAKSDISGGSRFDMGTVPRYKRISPSHYIRHDPNTDEYSFVSKDEAPEMIGVPESALSLSGDEDASKKKAQSAERKKAPSAKPKKDKADAHHVGTGDVLTAAGRRIASVAAHPELGEHPAVASIRDAHQAAVDAHQARDYPAMRGHMKRMARAAASLSVDTRLADDGGDADAHAERTNLARTLAKRAIHGHAALGNLAAQHGVSYRREQAPVRYQWIPWVIKSGPRKGQEVWKNLATGEIRDEDPESEGQDQTPSETQGNTGPRDGGAGSAHVPEMTPEQEQQLRSLLPEEHRDNPEQQSRLQKIYWSAMHRANQIASIVRQAAPEIIDTSEDFAKLSYYKAGDYMLQHTSIGFNVWSAVLTQVASHAAAYVKGKLNQQSQAPAGYALDDADGKRKKLAKLVLDYVRDLCQPLGIPAEHLPTEDEVLERLRQKFKGDDKPEGYSQTDRMIAYEWVPWVIKSGPRKGSSVWKNTQTGSYRTKEPAAKTKRTVDEVHAHVSQHLGKGSIHPDAFREMADHIQSLSIPQINELKRRLGIRAGGNKSAMAQKLSAEVTKEITMRQHWTREARKAGVDPNQLRKHVTEIRNLDRDVRREFARCIKNTADLYSHYNRTKLTRSNPAFREGDHTSLGHWDEVVDAVRWEHPELFSNNDDADHEQRLVDIVNAGVPRLKSWQDYYQSAMDEATGQAGYTAPDHSVPPKRKPKNDDSWLEGMDDDVPFSLADFVRVYQADDAEELFRAWLELDSPEREEMADRVAEMLDDALDGEDGMDGGGDPDEARRLADEIISRHRSEPGDDGDDEDDDSVDYALDSSEWTQATITRGPRKGTSVWKNTRTGATRDSMPEKKKSADDVRTELRHDDAAKPEKRASVELAMSKMTVAQLTELRDKIGLKTATTGAKKDYLARLQHDIYQSMALQATGLTQPEINRQLKQMRATERETQQATHLVARAKALRMAMLQQKMDSYPAEQRQKLRERVTAGIRNPMLLEHREFLAEKATQLAVMGWAIANLPKNESTTAEEEELARLDEQMASLKTRLKNRKKQGAGDVESSLVDEYERVHSLRAACESRKGPSNEEITSQFLEGMMHMAGGDTQSPSSLSVSGDATATTHDRSQQALGFMSHMFSGMPAEVKVTSEAGCRAKYRQSSHRDVLIRPDEKLEIVVHEMCHMVEHTNPEIGQRSVAFLQSRIGSEKPKKLNELFPEAKYRDDEITCPDDFARAFGGGNKDAQVQAYAARKGAYAGKIYPEYQGSKPTEILSIGLEFMIQRPAMFITGDPDFAGFVISQLWHSRLAGSKPA